MRFKLAITIALFALLGALLVACGDDDSGGRQTGARDQGSEVPADGGSESSENGQIPGSRAATGNQPLGTGQLDPNKPAIVVPYNTFITGPAAFVGESQMKGVNAFVAWLNEHGGINGHRLEVQVFDDQSDPSQTVNLYRRVADDNRFLVVGSGGLNQMGFKDLSSELKLPCVCLPGTSQLDTPVAPYLFTSEATAEDFHLLLLEYAQAQGWKTVALLRGENAYDDNWVAVIREEGPKYGIEVIAEEQYPLTATTYVTQLTRLRDSGADWIHIFAPNPAVWKEVAQLGIDKAKVTSDHPGSVPPILLAAGEEAVGIVVTQPKAAVYEQVLNPSSPHYWQSQLFATEFAKVTSDPPDAFALFGWNIMHIASEAIRRAQDDGDLSREHVRDVIESIDSDLVTAMGVIAFSPESHRALGKEAFTLVQVGPNATFTALEGYY